MAWATTSEAAPARSAAWLRRRSLSNLLRMGHCAPTVAQTMLEASGSEARWPVRLVAGLPGGIGNSGGECGGVTAPLVLLGLRHGRRRSAGGLPVVIEEGIELLRRFSACHGTLRCGEILGQARLPLRCVGVVRRAPELGAPALAGGLAALPAARREAYCRLCAHLSGRGFHCAHAVLQELRPSIPVDAQLLAATSGYLGGTALQGLTCSALTAGVMALGLALGEIEDSRLRVLRMIGTMAVGGDAFRDDLNAFNRTMNLGHRLARWFAGRYGSLQCRAITGCDFATAAGVERYVAGGGVERCAALAREVAEEVDDLIAFGRTGAERVARGAMPSPRPAGAGRQRAPQ